MNDPTLFIDSVADCNCGKENQDIFDSRFCKKNNKIKHRIADIEAMLYYRINVLAEVYTKSSVYEGVVLEINEAGLVLQILNEKVTVPILEIENINILKI